MSPNDNPRRVHQFVSSIALGVAILVGLSLWYWHLGTCCDASALKHGTSSELVLGLARQPASALVMVALEKQYFQQQGLQVTVLEYPSGKRALHEGLFTGKADIVTTADVPLAIAGAQQRDVRVIAEISSAENVNRIVARSDAGIESPADLVGKRIATQRASAVHFLLNPCSKRNR